MLRNMPSVKNGRKQEWKRNNNMPNEWKQIHLCVTVDRERWAKQMLKRGNTDNVGVASCPTDQHFEHIVDPI